MSDKPLNKKTTNEIIDSFLAVEDMSTADKLHMFVQLVDEKKLLESLKHHDLCLRMEMVLPDPIFDFAYGVLKLAKPHLFEEKET